MTQLEIINLSLRHLGMVAITQSNLTNNNNPSAIAANAYWEICRDEVLGESNWSFATATQAVSAVTAIDDAEWEYAYSYPTLAVSSIWSVYNDYTVTDKDRQEFEVKYVPSQSNKFIFTDLESVYAEFTYKVTDTTVWSNKFIMAFSYKLAASMVPYLGIGSDKAITLTEIYNSLISDAKRLGNSEKRKVPIQNSKYLDSR